MTDQSPIRIALAGAEILSADGSEVSRDPTTLLGRLLPRQSVPEESRVGGVEEATTRDADTDPWDGGYDVEAMNRRHALVLMGSSAVVMDENPQAPIEERHVFRKLEAFHAWYGNTWTPIPTPKGLKYVPWSQKWMSDPKRRQYSGVCFFPNPDGAAAPPGYYNFWKGFTVTPKRGGTYKIFRDHLLTNVCGGNQEQFRWVVAFFAHMLQRPRERIGVALVMRGRQGVGKTKPVEVIASLITANAFLVDDPRYITGNFNAHMASCILLCAEEAVWAGDKVAAGRLKGLITSKFQMIEHKGVDPIRLDNYVRIVMTSNEGWVVPADKDDRRYAVFDVSDRCKENHDYFREMDEELDNGGREALLYDLLNFDLNSVNLRSTPKTDALLDQKIRSFSSIESWWFELLKSGHTPKSGEWEREVPRHILFNDYLDKADRIGIKRRAAETEVGVDLRKLVPSISEARPWLTDVDNVRKRMRVWRLPPLDVCRAEFEAALGQAVDWGDPDIDLSGEGKVGDP